MSTQEDHTTKKSSIERDRYRIVSKVESGGMADIYLGVQVGEEALDRLVVIKKIGAQKLHDNEVMGMFLDEARIVASLNHPHIVKIFDLSKVKKSICITMEYVDGENLAYMFKDLAKRQKTFPLHIACQLMIQTCEALQYAHTATARDGRELNIVHRDLDLRNLMIDRHGYIKIIDFGVAKASTQLEKTAPTIFKGKLSYSAPEAFVEPTVDHRADLYALGLVFRQLVTGQKPFRFGSDANVGLIIQTISKSTLPPATSLNKDLPPEINALLDKATEKNREYRFQTAADMANAITDFAEQHGNGIAKSGEIRGWFQDEFADRVKQRKAFEQGVLEKARILAAKIAAGELEDVDSIIPEPGDNEEVSAPKESTPPSVPTRKEPIPRDVPLINHTDARVPAPITDGTSESVSDSDKTPLPSTPGTGKFPNRPDVFPNTESFNQADSSLSMPSSHMYANIPIYRRVNPYILLGVIFAMLLAGALIFQKLFWNPPKPAPAVEQQLGAVNLQVTSSPGHAEVYIDKKRVGTTGADGLKLRVKSGQMHTIRIEKEGYDIHKTVVWGKPSSLQVTEAILVKSPVEKTLIATEQEESKTDNGAASTSTVDPSKENPTGLAAKPSGRTGSRPKGQRRRAVAVSKQNESEKSQPGEQTKTSKEEPETAKPTSESTWLSKTGDWSGAQVASRGCLSCHKDGILLMSKTEDEWQRFFLQGQYNRYKNLNNYFSKQELTRVLAYILRKIEKRKEAENK
ncbi:MAG: protein kinase [Proteobacteria bacterium]|nr:protein kinase [Pseudomonadota bacterium]